VFAEAERRLPETAKIRMVFNSLLPYVNPSGEPAGAACRPPGAG
jgi:hypothetical protein